MKKIFLLLFTLVGLLATGCEKDKVDSGNVPSDLPRTDVPAELQASWMFGNFSMTEYWSQYPGDYLGNAFEAAIAFQFHPNGEYTHYFTSSYVILGVTTYQQSVTRGTVEIDPVNKKIKTHPFWSHYKRTKNRKVEEDRDMKPEVIKSATTYNYTIGVEPNGTQALYLLLPGTTTPLTFYKK